METRKVSKRQAQDFLAGKYGSVQGLESLAGGFWASAYSFSLDGRELVIRFGPNGSWFEADRAAMAFDSPDLPVPDVIEIGDAFDGAFAVSVRHYGINLEDVRPEQSDTAGPMLAALLGALFRVAKNPDLPVGWHPGSPPVKLTWRGWLRACLTDDAEEDGGWRAILAGLGEADLILQAAEARIRDLVEVCPERRDLVHGDLLNANVLVADDASHPTALFSWKCSVRGDFLFDAAWCTFWSPWHPGIAASNLWSRVQHEPSIRDAAGAWVDAALRHHCYELHIGVTHLRWNVLIGDLETVKAVAVHLSDVLDGGPLPTEA